MEISERILRLDNGWLRFMHQLNFVRRIEHMMEEDHQRIHEETLRMLSSKLQTVTAILKRLVKLPSESGAAPEPETGAGTRLRYAFKKESLDKAIEEFELWQRTADQSWFLLMRIRDPRIDAALADPEPLEFVSNTASAIPSTVTIRSGLQNTDTVTMAGPGLTFNAEELSRMTTWQVPYSSAFFAQPLSTSGATTTYILNTIRCQPLTKYNSIKKDARDLARKLQHNDPHTFGLLSCKGLAIPSRVPFAAPGETEPNVALTLVFRVPPRSGELQSLRDLLVNTSGPASLSGRFDMARELAKCVSFVHTFGFVHKTIRPESFLTSTLDNGQSHSVFLVGFENFRREDGWTQRRGDNAPDRNLYRHPSRQGACPREDFILQHDIYSLGVCLLEIGLWQSFFTYSPQDGKPILTGLLGIEPGVAANQIGHFVQMKAKDSLLHLAQTYLPRLMGTRYAEIVSTCLTCLDPDNGDFGDTAAFQDEDGIQVGVRYIEKVSPRK